MSDVTKRPSAHLSSKAAAADESGRYERLVREAVSGDRAAMERLLMRAQEVAFRFSLLVCGHPQDAEDVMQEALLKTYEHVGSIERPEAFRTWLFRTVRNACLMKRRRRVDEPAHVESIEASEVPTVSEGGGRTSRVDVADDAKGPGDLAVNTWLGKRLRQALGQIAPADRMIVLMREMEGLSTREVSAITGLSEANVKQRLHRARVRLREHLGDL